MKSFKYDIAISFGHGDLVIAKKIAEYLTDKNIRVYLYTDKNNAGYNLKEDTWNVYKENSIFALAIISTNYIKGKWAKEEIEVILTQPARFEFPYLLPVRVDGTKIDGLNSNVVYIDWTGNNADYIGDVVVERVKKFKARTKSHYGILKKRNLLLIGLLFILIWTGFNWWEPNNQCVIELTNLNGKFLGGYDLQVFNAHNDKLLTIRTNNLGQVSLNKKVFGGENNMSVHIVSDILKLTQSRPDWNFDTVKLKAEEKQKSNCVIELTNVGGDPLPEQGLRFFNLLNSINITLKTDSLGQAKFNRRLLLDEKHMAIRLMSSRLKLKNSSPNWNFDTVRLIGFEMPKQALVIELKDLNWKPLVGVKLELMDSFNGIRRRLTTNSLGLAFLPKERSLSQNIHSVRLNSKALKLQNNSLNWGLDTIRLIGIKIPKPPPLPIKYNYTLKLTNEKNFQPLIGVKVLMDLDSIGVTDRNGVLKFEKIFKVKPMRSEFLFFIKGKKSIKVERPYFPNEFSYIIEEYL